MYTFDDDLVGVLVILSVSVVNVDVAWCSSPLLKSLKFVMPNTKVLSLLKLGFFKVLCGMRVTSWGKIHPFVNSPQIKSFKTIKRTTMRFFLLQIRPISYVIEELFFNKFATFHALKFHHDAILEIAWLIGSVYRFAQYTHGSLECCSTCDLPCLLRAWVS